MISILQKIADRFHIDLNLFSRKNSPSNTQKQNHIVLSLNQSGGQTAHTIINEGMPQRTIRDAREILVSKLKQYPSQNYQIHLSSGDQEIENLAREIDTALKEAGWTQKGFIYRLVGFYPPGITIEIREVNEVFQFLADILQAAGLKVHGNKTPNSQELRIYIGPNNE